MGEIVKVKTNFTNDRRKFKIFRAKFYYMMLLAIEKGLLK